MGDPVLNQPTQTQRGAADPGASVWVAASAGTGKTKVLTDRVLNLMLAGTSAQRILCLTFTKAAATEMSERIARELGAWAAADDGELEGRLFRILGRTPDDRERRVARQLFPRVLDAPGGLNIHTIHAFCQSVLGRFPLEAGVAPHFAVLDERDQAELMAMARDEVLLAAEREGRERGACGDAEGSLTAALAEVTRHLRESGFAELFLHLNANRSRIGALLERHGSAAKATEAMRRLLGLRGAETPRTVTTDACIDPTLDEAGLRLAVRALQEGGKKDKERAQTLARWLDAAAEDRLALFDIYAKAFLTKDSERRQPKVRTPLLAKAAAAAAPGAKAPLETEGERVLAVVMKCRAATIAQATGALLVLADALISTYERLKERRSVLDYDDLIARTARLLERDGGASWVHYKLDGGIDHVLIDEAQDTSPEQWRIVRGLTGDFFAGAGAHSSEWAEQRTVFAVGDVKQSIFSFQGAEPDQFTINRDLFGNRVRAAEQAWRPISLQTSFRSTRAVLDAVDAVFAGPGAAEGVNLDGEPVVHQAFRKLDGGSVEVWPPVVPRESDEPEPWKPPVERVRGDSPQVRLATVLAERIARMTGGSEVLESAGRPIRPGDVMVLVRRRTPLVEELVRQLKNRHVAVAGVDRMVLTEQMAVMDLMALARFALLPGDDLTLATVLKGPLIGLDEDRLFTIAHGRDGTLWKALQDKACIDEGAFADARDRLSRVLAMADAVPPFEFFATVLGPLGGRRGLLARLGRDVEDPLAEFLDLALAFERMHPPSLQGFLHWLEGSAVEVKRDLEQGWVDAVRVMTVHGAKGLQAPVVFLPDTMQVPRQVPPVLWPPDQGGGEGLLWPPYRDACEDVALTERERCLLRQEQEYRRLLYVAMTRARDRLIVCGWRGAQAERDRCWYRMIVRGMKDAPDLRVEEVEDPVLASLGETASATVLRLTCPQLEPPAPAEVPVAAVPPPLPQWANVPPAAEPQPPSPLAPSRPDEDEPPMRSPLAGDAGARFKRGRLIHRLLQSLPDLPQERRAATARAWLSRSVHRVPPHVVEEIVQEVTRVLEAPEWAHLFGPGSRAEAPITGVINARVISGQVDRLLITASAVWVVDFKSDRPPPRDAASVPSVYCRQMAAYRAALRAIYPDRSVSCALLWTDGPVLMALDEGLLDRYEPGD